jgi:diguanylate cyclase (GGDEF)-like protein
MRLDLNQFADSAYVRELRRGTTRMRFEPALELDYTHWHLQRVRLRLKIWFSLSALLCIFFTALYWSSAPAGSAAMMLDILGLAPCCVVLAWLPWSRHYRRFYLTVGWALGTGFYVLVAVLGVFALLRGAGEQLALLTLNVFAVFFFSGLMFRHASLTAALTLVAFAGAAVVLGLPYPILLRGMPILMLTGLIGAIVYRDSERSYRRNFLENALISELITRDPLCGLMNRRAFDEHLSRVWQSALRDQRALALLMIDIDLFKRYNDLRGHQAGDAALCSVAQVIRDCARRPLDMASRYGGEEFAIILYDVTLEHAHATAERLLQAVRNQHLKLEEQPGAAEVTVSVGTAVVTPVPGRTPQGAVQLADEALYEAKRAGRNRVVAKGPADYGLLDTGSFRTAMR